MSNRGEAVENRCASRTLRIAALAVTGLLPLVTVPGLEAPFSTPKLIILALWLAVGFGSLWALQQDQTAVREHWLTALLICWAALVSLSALIAPYASLPAIGTTLMPVACFIILVKLRPSPRALAVVLICSALVVALCALLQFVGVDPFRFLGWQAPEGLGPRMRVYATLGNPNFVCAFLCGVAPLLGGLGVRRSKTHSWLAVLVGTLLALAILATGSRAAVLAVAAALLWLGLTSGTSLIRLATPLALLTVLIIGFSPGRRLDETIRGRLYVWETVLPFLFERPFLGWGPGSFQLKYAQWETARLASNSGVVPARFAGLQDHAHNDYLEVAVERGWPGTLLLLLTPACLLVSWLRRQPSSEQEVCLGRWAGASVLVLLAIALVDFPLHRPTEGFLFWTLMALVYLCSRPNSDRFGPADQGRADNRNGGLT